MIDSDSRVLLQVVGLKWVVDFLECCVGFLSLNQVEARIVRRL